MKFIENNDSSHIVIELTRAELAAIADIGLEVTSGSLVIPDAEWRSALLPVTKAEGRRLFDDLRALLKVGG